MRAITVRQPWAWAIVHGGKDVENCSRNIAGGYRGPVAIHAGLAYDEDAVVWGTGPIPVDEDGSHREPRGAIIGVVDLVDVHYTDACRDFDDDGAYVACALWAMDPYWHLILANPRPLSEPIPARGRLGLWTVPDDIAARIEAAS